MKTIDRIYEVVMNTGVPRHKVAGAVASACGVSAQAVHAWRRGEIKEITADHLAAIAKKWGTSVDYLLTGKHKTRLDRAQHELRTSFREINEAIGVRESNATYEAEIDAWDDPDEEDSEHVSRPLFLNAELAAGSGKLDTAFDEGHRIKFSRRTLSKCGVQPENAYGLKVSGNSMEPVIPDGATAGIDAGNTSIKDGKLYAILHGEMLRVKLLYKLPGSRVRIASYNKDEYPDEVESFEGGNLKVLGRVFWYSVLI